MTIRSTKTLFAAALVAGIGLLASGESASAFGCPAWMCGDNGTQLTGILQGVKPVVTTVTLPSGEKFELPR